MKKQYLKFLIWFRLYVSQFDIVSQLPSNEKIVDDYMDWLQWNKLRNEKEKQSAT